ncbi:HD domain-containing protein [Apibacter adventoris]|uniref:Metal-dependent phosphohydrolase n=1 Tax=Apibacter adventoris TaxID=1679466 RepID=A0A2S8A8X5_9FLAO|nr:HD domain-containing protein [Apibacter adventoris]PQL90970.1 metal-dependent phosphohydrolase [Apibacter adventoris]
MNQTEHIKIIKEYVKEKLSMDSSGHDYWHIERVVNNAQKILPFETANNLKVIVSAWLHDIGDYKLNNGKDKTEEIVFPLLISLEFSEDFAEEIIQIISEVSYKGGHNSTPSSLEAKIVQDADRLDAMGAVGIARAFAYGGSKGRELYNPEESPNEYIDMDSYKKNTSCTINHFYEKLLKLKDLMNTETAKKIALERHNYMINFLEEFHKEVL